MVQTTSEVPNPLRPEQDANAMVQEMLRDAEVAPEPEVGDRVLDDGSGDLPRRSSIAWNLLGIRGSTTPAQARPLR
jgi:hypothetical protein